MLSPEALARPRRLALAVPRLRWRALVPREATVLFTLAFAAYVTLGAVLVFGLHSVMGDAMARVANAHYVLYSRDPHLGAIGFVWGPLPTLAVLPLLPFKALIPGLVDRGFAANLVSAACMAGAVVQLRGFLADMGAGRLARLLLTGAFALHPMILYYGANGMTEAMFIFLLVLAARSLCHWTRTGDVAALATTGLTLGLGYLTRYETAATGLAVTAVVALVTLRRAEGDRRARWRAAAMDCAIVAGPLGAAAVGWGLAGWLIVGTPFEEFTSAYGNSSFVSLGAGDQTVQGAGYMARQILGLEPMLLVGIALVAFLALFRGDSGPVAAAVVVASALAFQMVAFLADHTYGFLRYYILVVPLATILAGAVIARPPLPAWDSGTLRRHRSTTAVLTLLALGLVAPGIPTAAATMRDRLLGPQEWKLARTVERTDAPLAERRRAVEPFWVERDVAAHLDGLGLDDGSVLVDVAFGFPIVLASDHPEQFVIPSDRDFEAALANPSQAGIDYVLAVPNRGLGQVDALNRAYPGVFDDGAGLGAMVEEFRGAGIGWRLYRVPPARRR